MIGILLLIIGWVIWTNVNFITSHLTIKNQKIPSDFKGYKIAEIADLHNYQWGNTLISRLKIENPDMIVIAGDFVDSSHTDFEVAMEFVEKAKDIAPTYYVNGNHEAWLNNYSELEDRLISAGVHMMDDRSTWIRKGESKINLIGI